MAKKGTGHLVAGAGVKGETPAECERCDITPGYSTLPERMQEPGGMFLELSRMLPTRHSLTRHLVSATRDKTFFLSMYKCVVND